MKVLHLEASDGWGGQEMRILHEAEGMRKRGHEIILAVMKKGALIHRAREKGLTVYSVNFQRYAWPLALLQLLWIMVKHKIDIVNTHSSLDSWIGGIAARLARKKIIRTRHFSTAGRGGWNSRILYGWLADIVATVCRGVIPTLSQQSGKPRSLFRAIPTGITPHHIDSRLSSNESLREKLGVGKSTFLVGTACFMRSWKGIQDFLKAADLLRDKEDIRWVIIGGGHAETYHKIANDLKLEGIVHFTGHLENPFPAMRELDAFTLLSTAHEGVSQAIEQAAYLERPLIATPTGGLAEICLPEVTGIQVPIFSPQAVAQAVERLKQDPSLCKRLGKQAKEHILRDYTFDRTLDLTEEVYRVLTF